jgi:hypothetical protein
MRKSLLGSLILCVLVLNIKIFSQAGGVKIGASSSVDRSQGAYFDYADPEAINITVAVWGYVKYPGKYLVPNYCTIKDLLSYSGGPTDDAHLDDLSLYKVLRDSTKVLYKINYSDIINKSYISPEKENLPKLEVGDLLIVPGEPKLYFKDYFSFALSAVSTLVSVATLIVVIFRK